MHLYIACNDTTINEFTHQGLGGNGCVIQPCTSVDEALTHAGHKGTVMLDLALPEADEAVRNWSNGTPLVVLVESKHPAEGEPPMPENGVRLRKPFCLAEVTQALRQANNTDETPDVLRVGPLVYDRTTNRITREGQSLRFYPQGQLLLEYMMQNEGQVVSREFILHNYFDYTARPRPNLVDVLISRVRTALDKGFQVPLLHTVRGQGYMLKS